VKFLGAPLFMVVGHTNCGAVSAAVKVVRERAELPGHLPELIKLIEPAVIAAHERHPSDLVAAAIEENVKLNVKRMYRDSPILSEALAAKTIGASGGVYDIATGKINMTASSSDTLERWRSEKTARSRPQRARSAPSRWR
jgi:carbonic anhydrase